MNERSESNDSQNEASERVIPTDKKIVLFGSWTFRQFKRQLFKLGTVNVFSDRNLGPLRLRINRKIHNHGKSRHNNQLQRIH